MQQVGVVALLLWRLAPGEALEGVLGRGEAGAPGLVGEGRISDDVVVGAELLTVLKLGRGQGVAYSQNIRTHLPAEGYAPIISYTSTCLPPHHHPYSASRG